MPRALIMGLTPKHLGAFYTALSVSQLPMASKGLAAVHIAVLGLAALSLSENPHGACTSEALSLACALREKNPETRADESEQRRGERRGERDIRVIVPLDNLSPRAGRCELADDFSLPRAENDDDGVRDRLLRPRRQEVLFIRSSPSASLACQTAGMGRGEGKK